MTKAYIHIDPNTNSFGIVYQDAHKERPPRLHRELFKHLGKNRQPVLIEVADVVPMTEQEALEFLKNGERFDQSKHCDPNESEVNQ